MTSIRIPSAVTSIGTFAFENCKNLTHVIIPESVISFGAYAFEGCKKVLLEGYSGSKAERYAKRKGRAYKILDKAPTGPAKGKTITKGSFKYKVTKQGKRAMNVAKAVQGSLRIIGFAKASKKKSATSVVIPATIKVDGISYKVTEIGANAFKDMPKLKKVTIGANVTKIGKGAFRDSTKLKTVTVKTKTLKSVGANAFKSIRAKAVFKLSIKKMGKKAKAALILKYRKLVKKGKAPSSTKVK